MAQDAAGGRYDIQEFDRGWFGSSALFCCLYPLKLALTGKLKLREKRAAWCWREIAKGGGREQHERTPSVDSWTSDLCIGGMSSMGRWPCGESQLSQLERQKELGKSHKGWKK